MSDKKNIGGLIKVFLLAIVGLALTPTIQENVAVVTHANNGTSGFPAGGTNLTGSARALLVIFPLFWTILMIAIPVAYVSIWLKGT